jgi:hypothetical protein
LISIQKNFLFSLLVIVVIGIIIYSCGDDNDFSDLLIDSPGEGSGYPGCPNWDHKVKFVNKCAETVTINVTNGCYPTAPNDPPFNGKSRCWPAPILNGSAVNGSFQLKQGETKTLKVVSCWSGNFGTECQTCKTKIQTLVEFTFDGGVGIDPQNPNSYIKLPGLLDNYDTSFVDGFVNPLGIVPDDSSCPTSGCKKAPECPSELKDGDACLSPCQYIVSTQGASGKDFNRYCCICNGNTSCTDNPSHTVPDDCKDQYGCSPFSHPGMDNNYGSTCCPWYDPSITTPFNLSNPIPNCSSTSQERAWEQWAQDYIANVHETCPGQYAWQFDDRATTQCQGDIEGIGYTISIYCPE